MTTTTTAPTTPAPATPARPGASRPCRACRLTVTNAPHGWQAAFHVPCVTPTGRHDGGATTGRVSIP